MRQAGINGVADIPMIERIKVQQFILDRFIDNIQRAPRPSITDRTPLDMIGYMLGEVTMHNTPQELHEPIQTYVDNCINAAERYFDMALIVRPLPNYKVQDSRPPLNPAYQTMVQFIIEGAGQNATQLYGGIIQTTDFEERCEATCGAIKRRLADLVRHKYGLTSH